MKQLIAFLFVSITLLPCSAQKQMSLEDAIRGRYSYLNPKMLNGVKWQDNKHFTAYNNDTIWQYTIGNNNKKVLLDKARLTQAFVAQNKSYTPMNPVEFINTNELLLKGQSLYAIYNFKLNQFSHFAPIPEEAIAVDYCTANHNIAYVRNKNLYVQTNLKETQVTHETANGIVVGQIVHRNEFGISKGTFWSPSGKYLAFYRKDESRVKEYPLTDYMAPIAENNPIRYPMAGENSEQVTIGIFNTQTQETIYLQSGEADEHYLTNISWDPEEKFIYVAELNREQNNMHLNQYNVNNGAKLKSLINETSNTYVEPQYPMAFLNKTPNQFIYMSRKDGFFHLYLYNTNGECLKQLTQGDWEVTKLYGIDANDKYAYIQCTKNSPLDRNIYSVNLSTGNITQIDGGEGFHEANFSPSFNNYIDTWSAHNIPGQTDMRQSSGKLIQTIIKADDTLADYELGENKLLQIKAADGKTNLYGCLTLPNNFNPNKKYPAIIYVYGGPHVQLINNSWHYNTRWWYYYMASKGYIVLALDSRGSAYRGQAFEEVIFRQLGIEETKDQMEGVKYLQSLNYVDQDRIGVHGWSFGGFMTTNLMTRHPEVFKVGVAGGPVVDWALYEVMYGERYMDTPAENPRGYQESNMLNQVKNLQGKLLYIHGAQDNVVVPQHSMKFLRECIKQGKDIDFFIYPTHEHNVIGPDRVHLMNKVSQYFFDYL